MLQYTLPLQKSHQYNSEDFIFSTCNAELKDLLNNAASRWGYEPYPEIVLLVAPESSGKTYFCHLVKQQDSKIIIFDDIDSKDETEIFHAFNICHEKHQRALFTCKEHKNFTLQDLKSRLSSVRLIRIDLPDDLMMKSLLVKSFTERSIKISDDIIKFLMARIPRSFAAIENSVESIDRLSIEQKRNISLPFLSSLHLWA